jgi:methyltransferase-like protein
VEHALESIEDGLELEQWLDFVTNRNFRQSLLCRANAPLEEEIAIDLERFAVLAFRCDLRPVKAPDLRREKATPFATPAGVRFQVSHPLTKALLVALAERFPDSLSLEDLMPLAVEAVGTAGGGPLATQVDACLAELFSLFAHRAVAAQPAPEHLSPPDLAHPRLCPLTRAELAREETRVTTRHHGNLDLDAFAARLLTYLDGTRTPGQLVQRMAEDLRNGDLEPPGDLRPRQWPQDRLLARVRVAVQDLLGLLARHGLLEPARGDTRRA